MPLKTLNQLYTDYHDQMQFMFDLAAAVADPKHLFFSLEGAATLQKSIMLNSPIYIAQVTLSNGTTAIAGTANTTAIDVSQYDNVTPTKIGNSIATKASTVALGASLSLVLVLSATLTDRFVNASLAVPLQIQVTKTIVGTQASAMVDVLYWDVPSNFVPA